MSTWTTMAMVFGIALVMVASPIGAQDDGLTDAERALLESPGWTDGLLTSIPTPPPDWGTTYATWITIPANACSEVASRPISSSYGWVHGDGTGPRRDFDCWVPLTAGTMINGIGLVYDDSDGSQDLQLVLYDCPLFGTTCTAVVNQSSSGSGGRNFLGWFPASVTIESTSHYYYVRVILYSPSATQAFRSVYISARLQVSPAPATATFSDVPTYHWAFQHVEALADSGITTGCGGGNFCPDSNVTRAQMAVFLAKALGLFWPN